MPALTLLLGVALLGGPGAGVLAAQPEEDEMVRALLDGPGDGAWRGTLLEVLERAETDPQWMGETFGALFRDRETFADDVAPIAYAAAFLVDHPASEGAADGRIPLAADIVRRLHRDEAFLARFRSHITGGPAGPGWQRILGVAEGMLGEAPGEEAPEALWLLSHETGKGAERVLYDVLLPRARALAQVIGERGDRAGREGAWLDALERMLAYRFPTLSSAVATLDEIGGRDLLGTIRLLSRRKDEQATPDRAKLVDWGKRLIDAAVAARNPKGLEEFLDPRRTPFPEVRRHAIQRATTLGPKPDAMWSSMLCASLTYERDPDVLRGVLDLLERTAFGEAADAAEPLARCVVVRLRNVQDPPPDRVRLAKVLGGLRNREAVLDALDPAGDRTLASDVLAELIRALGAVEDPHVEDLLSWWRASESDTERDRKVRLAVADALGRPAFRGDGEVAAAAAEALRAMLMGDGSTIRRATGSAVRQNVIRSLGSHPAPATSEALAEVARGPATPEGDAEAQVAIVVLGKAALAHPHAVEALAEVVGDGDVPTPRRIEALQALARLDAGGDAERLQTARAAATAALAASAPEALRMAAARAAVDLRAAGALPSVVALHLGVGGEETKGLLRDLVMVLGTGADPEANDAALEAAILRLAEEGAGDLALELVAALREAAPRVAWQLLEARLLFDRAAAEDGEPAAQRGDLDRAHELIAAALGNPLPQRVQEDALRLDVEVLAARAALADEPAAKAAHLLTAVEQAARSSAVETARRGRALAETVVADGLREVLDDGQQARLDRAISTIEQTLQG